MRILTIILSLACVSVFGTTPQEAVELKKKAEKGDVFSQYLLGCYYVTDIKIDGVDRDPEEAVKWFRKAAEQGYAPAQSILGACYQRGDGVMKDPVKAVKWYKKSAEQGNAEAQYNLGLCYYNGEGVVKDPVEGIKWLRKSAERGLDYAQFNLGVCYYGGEVVLRNPVEAYAYFNLARVTLEVARENCETLEREMSPSQIESGQKRSREIQALIDANKKAEKK